MKQKNKVNKTKKKICKLLLKLRVKHRKELRKFLLKHPPETWGQPI